MSLIVLFLWASVFRHTEEEAPLKKKTCPPWCRAGERCGGVESPSCLLYRQSASRSTWRCTSPSACRLVSVSLNASRRCSGSCPSSSPGTAAPGTVPSRWCWSWPTSPWRHTSRHRPEPHPPSSPPHAGPSHRFCCPRAWWEWTLRCLWWPEPAGRRDQVSLRRPRQVISSREHSWFIPTFLIKNPVHLKWFQLEV